VVDADRRVRQSLSGLIGLAGDLTLIGAAADPAAALAYLEREAADVVLIDPRLPEIDVGLALLVELHRRWPSVALVAMSYSDDLAHPSLRNGALAFVAKSGQPEALIEILRASGARSRAKLHD
jgi:DNA-binding NarL/FixJ family response regulator